MDSPKKWILFLSKVCLCHEIKKYSKMEKNEPQLVAIFMRKWVKSCVFAWETIFSLQNCFVDNNENRASCSMVFYKSTS